MDLARIILGPVVTEKAERLKAEGARRTYTMKVAPEATKVEIARALERFYDVKVAAVRVIWARGKSRLLGAGRAMEKRHPSRKALVTLAPGSRALDLAAFRTT